MSHPGTVIVAILALSILYVMIPVMMTAIRHFRGVRRLRYPEAGRTAEVAIDRRHAALTSVLGKPRLRVSRCTLWPERMDCPHTCMKSPQSRFSKV
ncbi:MAG: hypothetical protein QGH70_08615 [Nitrospinota bacterium]|jgi:hypothetical protein|nr:hypothetical protein [Nitrospinota bacterium]MDP6483893.1 hypothetical protein [Nitrospinota bacterium]MDP6619484.1 hypothetical protein [Nitrospinota bacterium]MDP7384713.1 hypothetical protein [Nitrospinota bacterium]HJM42570.1 hypothetical protein [Nitrospinota bacterium]